MSVSGEKGCASLAGFLENNLGFQVSVAGRLAAHQPALHSVEDPQEGPDHPHVSDSPRVWIVTVTSQRLSGEPDGDSFFTPSPLPNAHRTDTDEVCLFVRDEPKMTSEQTQRFYKKMLEENGVKSVTEVHYYMHSEMKQAVECI